MSKYDPLWEYAGSTGKDGFSMTFDGIEKILGFPIDHSFLNFKNELAEYGYAVKRISMKKRTVEFERTAAEDAEK